MPYIVVETHFDEQSRHSASEAFFALRIYFAEHGELPARLDQLVPAYLPAVPLDFYDRQPIRYSHDNFAVWSVGFRHFNVTSINPDPEETQNEIYYRLDFAAPPRPVPVEDPPESSP